MEFLLEIEVSLPHDLAPDVRERLLAEELRRGKDLAAAGTILAIWRVPGRLANRAIWSAPDPTSLHEAITSLPLWPYLDVEVTPLARHAVAEACHGVPPGPASNST